LYTHAGANGFYRSTDTGASWVKISTPAIDMLLNRSSNIRFSIGAAGTLYAAICGASGGLVGLVRSGNGGATWSTLDLPRTVEKRFAFGLHPGGQGAIHLAIAADRSNPDLVYIGGDRQPSFNEGTGENRATWPNSLGATDYTGRLFRIDASRPSGSQSTTLTHSGTASGSAPHADSRNMVIAANGMLLESCDGGVYRRTRPQAADGDWFSMNGDLQVTEFHSVAWDANCRTAIGGAQDTGTPQQTVQSAERWDSVSTGDGGVVAVDSTSTPGLSTRYSSYHGLIDLRRQVFNAAGVLQSRTPLALRVLAGGPRVQLNYSIGCSSTHLCS